MAVKGGAKAGIFVPDEAVLAYAKARGRRSFEAIYPDEDASYAQRIEIDVAALNRSWRPQLSGQHATAGGALQNQGGSGLSRLLHQRKAPGHGTRGETAQGTGASPIRYGASSFPPPTRSSRSA